MTGPVLPLFLPALAFLVPLAAALVAPSAQAQPRRYTLDPAGSQLKIHVGKSGVFGFAGHEHDVVAGTFHGTATFDPDRIAQSAVDLTFEAGALRVTGEGAPKGDAAEVQAAMIGAACLDVHRFPAIHFVSKTVAAVGEAAGGGRDLSIAGALTLHGVTRPLTIRVRLEIKGDALEATGSTTIRQTDFGMTPISKAGVVKVKDELALSWQIRGTAR
jgi:polyisoprenoid-binding protein YceI